jgi:RNA polymerase sigma-70 factor (ECF subfamily)
MATEYHHATRQKRGGTQPALPLEFGDGEQRYTGEPSDSRTPEDAFEAQWAAQVFASAGARLDAKHKEGWMRGSRFFATLARQVLDERDESFADMAARLQTTEGSLRVLAHRVRQQFGMCLREVIADTVDSPAAIDDELRHLLKVLGRRHASWCP